MSYFEFVNKILEYEQFSLNQNEKEKKLYSCFEYLNSHHIKNCDLYRNLLANLYPNLNYKNYAQIESIPFIPVQLFKDFDLLSVEKNMIFKTMLSSGTSGKNFSKIFLDKDTSRFQSKVLSNIVSSFMLIFIRRCLSQRY